MCKPKASPQPYMWQRSLCHTQSCCTRAVLAAHPMPRPHSVVHTMPFGVQRAERTKTTCTTLAGTGQGGQRAPSGGASRKADTHSFIHLWWARAQPSLGLLLKEITELLLLQLSVVPLDLPIGLFHIIIHELVHEWVKIGLVPKEVNKLGAIVKVACR